MSYFRIFQKAEILLQYLSSLIYGEIMRDLSSNVYIERHLTEVYCYYTDSVTR